MGETVSAVGEHTKRPDIDQAIRRAKPAGWRGNRIKRKQVRNAIKSVIGESPLVDEILEIASHQNDY